MTICLVGLGIVIVWLWLENDGIKKGKEDWFEDDYYE